MKFARWTFFLAGVYGLLVIFPQYFMEARIGRDYPPPITHPEHFYGFTGVALAWQVAFLVIAGDPLRLRPMMLPGVLEKATFGLAAIVLFAQGRAPGLVLGFGLLDLFLGTLFAAAWWKTAGYDWRYGERRAHA